MIGWRLSALVLLCAALPRLASAADIEPETVGVETLGTPAPTWFIAKAILGPANVFDAATGRMLGQLPLSPWTPAVEPVPARGQIYAAEVFYSRGIRGERNDVVTVYDRRTLAPVAEIDVPDKIASLAFRHYIGLLDDGRHLAVYNLTPAQSVSIVDVEARRFVGEISTPGCALVMPTIERSFLMLCGDGNLQMIRLDQRGRETARVRSRTFFDLETDPVYDKPILTPEGWLLVSFEGYAFDVKVRGREIEVDAPWSLLSDADRVAGWRLGGGQVAAYHAGSDLLTTLMHQGEVDTHEEPGTEVWVFDRSDRRRIARIPLDGPVTNLHITAGAEPLLVAAHLEGPIDVFDLRTTTRLRTIAEPGLVPALLQGF
ncbi:MAG TPA: amine dehydrogenase large subunit [Pseudomonadales bacterium]